jgi:hypothetical protein
MNDHTANNEYLRNEIEHCDATIKRKEDLKDTLEHEIVVWKIKKKALEEALVK